MMANFQKENGESLAVNIKYVGIKQRQDHLLSMNFHTLPKFLKEIIDFFDDDGIVVEQAGLGNVEPDEATATAIQAVANAQYMQRQAEYEKQAAIAQAQTIIEQAKGNAEAKKIEADAEAYSYQKIQQALTPELVQVKWIEKWNGQLPSTSLGNSQGMMFNLGK